MPSTSAGSSGYSVGSPPQIETDRRAALVDGLQARLERQPIGQLAGVALDRAADARQVAGVERLQHQHERVALPAAQRLPDLVADHVGRDVQRKSHSTLRIANVLISETKTSCGLRRRCPRCTTRIDTDRRSAGALARSDSGTSPDRARDRSGARLAAGAPGRGRLLVRRARGRHHARELHRSCSRRSSAARGSDKIAAPRAHHPRRGAARRRLEPVPGRARRACRSRASATSR